MREKYNCRIQRFMEITVEYRERERECERNITVEYRNVGKSTERERTVEYRERNITVEYREREGEIHNCRIQRERE